MTPQLIFGLVGALVGVTALLTFAYRLGTQSGRLTGVEKTATEQLAEGNRRLEVFAAYIQKSERWQGTVDQILKRHDEEIQRKRDEYHDHIVPKLGTALALIPRVEALEERARR